VTGPDGGREPKERLVVIGEIVRPHGLRGEVRVTPLTDDPERFRRVTECVLWEPLRDDRWRRRIAAVRRQGDAVLIALDGCDSPEAARQLVGRLVAVPEAEALPLPPGHFYPWQLVGCRVFTEDGAEIGEVTGIEGSEAQEVWVVRGPRGEHLIPAVPEIVVDVDLGGRRVVVRPPEGLLEL
jgi:16S rRNA processing protein RimM